VARDGGLVVALDTELDDELRADGDARELTRAVQDLRKQVGLELDETIDLWLTGASQLLAPLEPYFPELTKDTLAASLNEGEAPAGAATTQQDVSGGSLTITLRGRGGTA
jgi:isoleucyl-tRNA synthetase